MVILKFFIIFYYFTLGYFQLFYVTFSYFKLFHLRLFSTIVKKIWLFYVIFGYCRLFHFRLFTTITKKLTILSYFILGHFRLCEPICRNLCLGLTTKARGLQGCGPRGRPRSCITWSWECKKCQRV